MISIQTTIVALIVMIAVNPHAVIKHARTAVKYFDDPNHFIVKIIFDKVKAIPNRIQNLKYS